MSNHRYITACTNITELARITSQLKALKRRANDLKVSDLAHLLGVAEIAATKRICKQLEEIVETPKC